MAGRCVSVAAIQSPSCVSNWRSRWLRLKPKDCAPACTRPAGRSSVTRSNRTCANANRVSTSRAASAMAAMPLSGQFCRKMSPKLGAMTALKP